VLVDTFASIAGEAASDDDVAVTLHPFRPALFGSKDCLPIQRKNVRQKYGRNLKEFPPFGD